MNPTLIILMEIKMAEYRQGAENIPLRDFNKSTPIMVFVIDLKNNDEIVQSKQLDYGNPEDRKYLGKLTYWAVTNNHSIETMALADANGE